MEQATNQPKFPIFAESETEFFLKVVDAQIEFFKNDKGEAHTSCCTTVEEIVKA